MAVRAAEPPRPSPGLEFERMHAARLAPAVFIGITAAYAVVVSATGTAPGPQHHLAYLAILVAAYAWGVRGALAATILPVVLSGLYPLVAAAEAPALVRIVVYLAVAAVTGLLFEHLRQALDAWRTTAVNVAQREHDGLAALARAAEARDADTGQHCLRVELVAARLALAAGVDEVSAADIGRAALLHDIGKPRVPEGVLKKPGPLSQDERDLMRMHPAWGEAILAHGSAFDVARRVARWHHENFDGSGYPDGLMGSEIPLEARIARIADAFDAMTSRRPYKDPHGTTWAMEQLWDGAGRSFDPELVRLFVAVLERDEALTELLSDPRWAEGRVRPSGHAFA